MRTDLIEDIYPLSPMQKGMLFETLFDSTAGRYIEQMVFTLPGTLDTARFARAWQTVVARHAVLRTSFHWEGQDEPLQVVVSEVELPLACDDWRGLSEAAQAERLDTFLADDRRRGFDLNDAPLLRLQLFRRSETVWTLCWTFHHILLDRWSVSRVLDEVAQSYAGQRLETPRPYGEYVAWLQEQDPTRAEAFWRKKLAGCTAPTILLAPDHRSTPTDDTPGIASLTLPSTITDRLHHFARQHQLTLNTLIQGAWALLLHRYSGNTDIVYGTIVAGRPAVLPDIESMVGLFINTLPTRVHCSAEEPLLPWLHRLQEDLVELRDYEYSSLVDIQGWSDIPRGTPLFEATLAFQNTPPRRATPSDGLAFKTTRALWKAEIPFSLQVGVEQQTYLNLQFAPQRLDPAGAQRLLRHFQSLLEGMVDNPQGSLGQLSPLTAEERHQLLVEWNASSQPVPSTCLHTLVAEQVERTPDAVAVRAQGRTWTYRQLDQAANQLAHALRAQGVDRGSYVGVALERSFELVVALLATLKAGGAYVPIDPEYPQDRIAYIRDHSHMAILLVQAHHQAVLSSPTIPTLCLDSALSAVAAYPITAPLVASLPSDDAYVLYTSGSTGTPKGVVIPHRAIVNHMVWMGTTLPLTAADRVLQKTPISFDASVWEFWAPLLAGAELVLAKPGGHRDPDYLAAELTQQRITILQLVPSLLGFLLDRPEFTTAPALRRVFCGGEELTPTLRNHFFARMGTGVALHNLYGPTEVTIDTTIFTCAPNQSDPFVPIGKPVWNTQLYVLDNHQQPVPIGVPGELYIGGIQLARGYLNREELTKERFVENPFGEGRLYKTGDLVKWLPDGNLLYLGRLDFQVKLRGFRIELGEIESALREQEGVREALVIAREDTPGHKRLVAYVVGETAIEVLRDSLKARLPEYMVPSAFVRLEAFPLAPNGKIDRKKLPAPQATEPSERGGESAAARNPIEEELITVWQQLLGVGQLGLNESFFALGGHSLLAIQLGGEITARFGVRLPLRTLFEAPTIAELAEAIRQGRDSGSHEALPPIVPVAREGSLPLSLAQQRLWFVEKLGTSGGTYHLGRVLRIRGALDRAALQAALDTLVQRHEALRTNFVEVDGEGRQVIHPTGTFPLQTIVHEGLSDDDRETVLRPCIDAEMERPFDLGRDRLIRGLLVRFADDDHALQLTLHHLVTDGWSMGILFHELSTLYTDFAAGKTPSLPALPLQYADYAAWQQQLLTGPTWERLTQYWTQQLAGAPPRLALPTDRPRETATGHDGGFERVLFPVEQLHALRGLCQDERTSPFMLLLTAFTVLLHRYTNERDIVIGTDEAGRQNAVEGLIGFFVNHLVLRNRLDGDPTFRELLQQVRETTLDAYSHQEMPFDKLVELLQPERSASHTPLFQVLFVLQTPRPPYTLAPELDVTPVSQKAPASKYDIGLFISDTPGRLAFLWSYRTALFQPATIQAMGEDLVTILTDAIADPEVPLSTLVARLLERSAQRALAQQEQRRLANRERLRPGLARA